MLGVTIGLKAFISSDYGYADVIDSDKVMKHIAGKAIESEWKLKRRNPIAARTTDGIQIGQLLGGNALGAVAALAGTIAAVAAAGAALGPLGLGIAVAGLLATGAAANLAAPVVLGMMGKRDSKPQGLCAKIGFGMIDAVWTPIMGMAYVGAKVGQGVGMAVGGLVGGGWGAARHYGIKAYERVLQPYLECAPVQNKLAIASDAVGAIAERVAACPMPEYSNKAEAFGQRLRARFSSLTTKPVAPAPAVADERHEMQTPTGTDYPTDRDILNAIEGRRVPPSNTQSRPE